MSCTPNRTLIRSIHAYDALCRSKCPAVRMGCAALVSGIVHLVGVQRTIQKNGNMKSEPEYQACEESPIRAFYFWTLLVLLSLYWLLRWAEFFAFFVSELPAVGYVQHSFMHLAPQIRTLRRVSRAALPVFCSQETSPWRRCVMHIFGILSRCEPKLTFRGWPQIDIPKRYWHVRTYIHTYITRIDPSFEASR